MVDLKTDHMDLDLMMPTVPTVPTAAGSSPSGLSSARLRLHLLVYGPQSGLLVLFVALS